MRRGLVLLGLLMVTGVAPAVGAANRLAAEDVFQFETISAPQISPDGSRIVYVRHFSDIMTDKRYSNLWIIGSDGSDHRPLTTGNYSDTSPRWSPDGTRLLFLSDREGSTQLYLRWMDTGQTARLTNLTETPSNIVWSPDGRHVAFTALVLEPKPAVAQMPAPPAGATWAEPATVVDRMVFRFNGPGYLKPGYQHWFVLPAEGGTPRQISSGSYHHGGPGLANQRGVWSPDGEHLVVSANRHPDYEHDPLDTEIYEFRISDGQVRALTNRDGPDNSPVISPDGRLIAYTGFDDRTQGHQTTRLYLMNRDGSGARVLSPELDRDARDPQWSSDGKGIYFLYDDQGNTKIAFASLDGRITKLADNVGDNGSSYASGSFTAANDGTFAFSYSRPNIPSDVAVGRREQDIRVLTQVNDDLLAGKELGAFEEIWYESPVDQRRIQGWIIKPPGFDPAKKYALILEIHGGPFANYGDRFDLEKQLWAARGYVVFYPNARGSTSYGEEFANLIHHAYPGDDFFDLNAGVDAVLARGYVDPDQVFVTGGSGGGVLTCWMIGRTERFRAAVTAYPVINWYSFVLTADIPSFVIRYWFPGYPWEHPEHYMKRSLTSLVGKVKTPTMVITGEEDYRTPMSESEQYFVALKLRGIESVLVRVPGEPHGIRRRPSHHIAKILNIVGWFDRYRKDDARAD